MVGDDPHFFTDFELRIRFDDPMFLGETTDKAVFFRKEAVAAFPSASAGRIGGQGFLPCVQNDAIGCRMAGHGREDK